MHRHRPALGERRSRHRSGGGCADGRYAAVDIGQHGHGTGLGDVLQAYASGGTSHAATTAAAAATAAATAVAACTTGSTTEISPPPPLPPPPVMMFDASASTGSLTRASAFRGAVALGNLVVFAPFDANTVGIYDVGEQTFDHSVAAGSLSDNSAM
eukprot:7132701-Prymnesium_polylepis.1